jgi:HEAT repeat protein
MLSHKDFVVAWGKNYPLVRFRKKALESLTLADEDKEFLAQAGLPGSAAPFLSVTAPKSGELPTVADQWKRSEEFRRYRIIGGDGSGNPLALDEERNGEVVCLDHDDRFARTFVNTTVRHLAASLLVYRDLIATAGEDARKDGILPAKSRKQLHQQLKKIDPAAMKPGGFWPEETGTADASADQPASVLQDLSSGDATVRLKASKQLESELRKAATKQRQEQFGNKNATTALIAVLDDPDPNIVHNGVVALAQITRNYFKDDRAYARLLELTHSKHPLTTRWVIDALIQLRGEASLDDVLPLCTDASPEARAMALSHLYSWLVAMRTARSGSVRPENQRRLREAALRALSDGDRTVRGNAASLLGEVGDATVLPPLRQALKKESYWLTEQTIANTIKGLEGRK